MKVVNFLSQVEADKCRGDRFCEKICPSGAIKVVEKKAVVNADYCVACGKCLDVCPHEAVTLQSRVQPLILTTNVTDKDQGKIAEICFNARCFPQGLICSCTGTEAQEVAAAILEGARSPEDLTRMTGIGSGCGIYCKGVIFRLFKAAGVEVPQDERWNPITISLWDIPPEVAKKYPQYFIEEDLKVLSGS